MIVDLLRNDLGRVCRPGSVRVPQLCALESYANVHHLVSVVTGELDAAHSPLDLLAAAFPGGSITGAPKVRAMQIIDELEPSERSAYCGSLAMSTCGAAWIPPSPFVPPWPTLGDCTSGAAVAGGGLTRR